MTLLYVALGSAIGGVGRFLIGGALQRSTSGAFPVGTLLVNVVGSFVLGFVARYALATPGFAPETRLFLTAGLCGGFTTFSTFSFESFELLEHGHHAQALAYMGSSLALGLLATTAGVLLARNVVSP